MIKKNQKGISLKNMLNIIQILSLLIIVIFFAYCEYRFIVTVQDDLSRESEARLSRILDDFNQNRELARNITIYMQQDETLKNRLMEFDLDNIWYSDYIEPFLVSEKAISGIYLILDNGLVLSPENGRLCEENLREMNLSANTGIGIFNYNLNENSVDIMNETVESGIYYCAGFEVEGQNIGSLIIDIMQLYQYSDIGNNLLVCDNYGNVLLQSDSFEQTGFEALTFTINNKGIASNKDGFRYVLKKAVSDTPLVFYYFEDFDTLYQYTFNFTIYACMLLILCLIVNHFTLVITSRYLLRPILELGRKMERVYIIGMTETFISQEKKRPYGSTDCNVIFFLVLTVVIPFLLFSSLGYVQNNMIIRKIHTEYSQDNLFGSIELLQLMHQRDENLLDTLTEKQDLSYEDFVHQIDTIAAKYGLAGLSNQTLCFYNEEGTLLNSGLCANTVIPDNISYNQYIWDAISEEMCIARKMEFASVANDRPKELTLLHTENMEFVFLKHLVEADDGLFILSDISDGVNDFNGTITQMSVKSLNNQARQNDEGAFRWVLDNWIGVSTKSYGEKYMITAMIPMDAVGQNAIEINIRNQYAMGLLLLIILFVASLLSARLSKMIYVINDHFLSINVLDKRIIRRNHFPISEFNIMEKAFNSMVEKNWILIDELISSNNEKNRIEIEKKDAEIRVLQAQINPHFFHNTLNSIVALIDNNQKEDAKKIVRMVGTLFRCGISRKDVSIPIKEEIEYLNAYLMIMALRFGKRLRYRIDIPEKLYCYKTIKLILQPIVENSLIHGYSGTRKNLFVSVTAQEEEQRILFTITDNGAGMTETQLYILRKQLEEKGGENKIGLINVQTRLYLYFGSQYGVEMESVLGEGTVVRIYIKKYE